MDSAPRQFRQVGRGAVVVLLLAVALLTGAAAGPGRAQAFVGESLVINPVTEELTESAESVLEKPTFLAENVGEAALEGGSVEAGAAASVFEGSLLPALGPGVLALGAGVGVGSLICHVVGIEGCWFFESDESQTSGISSGVGAGQWAFKVDPLTFQSGWYDFRPVTVAKYQYWWHFAAVGYPSWYAELMQDRCATSTVPVPPGTDQTPLSVLAEYPCGGGSLMDPSGAVKSPMKSRSLKHVTDAEAETLRSEGRVETEPAFVASPDWSEQVAGAIDGHSGDAAGRVGQRIASAIPGSEVHNPYGTYVDVPDCDGLVYASCADLLEDLELEPHREDLNWSDVETATPDEVRELEPAKSKEVEVGTGVKVITNPPEEGMPIVVPQPEPGETYDHYAARLNPALTPERHDLDAPYIDPGVGPDGVVSTSPEPGTRLDPSSAHKVSVSTNPADAPVPSAGWTPPAISSIDMDPISGVPSPCTVFPFGLFCWMGEAFAQFNTSGTCPHFSAPVEGTTADFSVTMCGDTAETIMGYLRPALLLAFTVGCGVMFAKGTKAIGGD